MSEGRRSPEDASGDVQCVTAAGSGIWNGLLIGLGALLGAQDRLIDEYSRVLNFAVYALALASGSLIVRGVRRRRNRRSAGNGPKDTMTARLACHILTS